MYSWREIDGSPPFATDPRGLRYVCGACGGDSHRDARTCVTCGARVAGVQCGHCRYVGPPDNFPKHVCPSCGIRPAPADDAARTDGDDRPIEPWIFTSRYSGWVDRRALAAVFGLAFVLMVVVPATGMAWPIPAAVVVGAYIVGAGLTWYGFSRVAWAKALPNRNLFYVAAGLALSIVVVATAFSG